MCNIQFFVFLPRCVSMKTVNLLLQSLLWSGPVTYLHSLMGTWLQYLQLPWMNILGLESEPLCVCQKTLLLHCQGKFPRDFCINITYLADRRHEEVANTGKLPQQPIPNQIWQVYSEVAILMCRGHREWLLDQLFPITVTVVNCVPWHMHLCIWLGEEDTPNICRMINLPTLPQIRGWISACALSGYIIIPGQLLTVGRWQIHSCIQQWNDKTMFLVRICCCHLSLLRSLICTFPPSSVCCTASPQAKTHVQLGVFSPSLFFRHQAPDLGYIPAI